MAEQQHFEGFDAEPEEESRSSHKRQAQAIRKLVEKIASENAKKAMLASREMDKVLNH